MLRLTEAACGVTVTDKFAPILVLYCIVQCLIITSRDAQRKARYSDRARPSVCLFVCLSVPF